MNQKQMNAAKEVMTEWLTHPNELGKTPAKIECAGEFDLDDLHYYIFKFKKSLLGKWMIGVCGGYEGDGLGHCGHVYSDMAAYDPASAQEKGKALVQFVRQYWMQQGQEQMQQPKPSPFLGFVLLSTAEWNVEDFKKTVKEDWGIDCTDESREDGALALSFQADGVAMAMLMEAPIPGGEAEFHAQTNYMKTQEAVEAAKKHAAHIVVSVMQIGGHKEYQKRGELFAKIVSTCLKAPNALGVYTNGTVLLPDYYITVAEEMKKGGFPLLDLVFVGIGRNEKGFCGYTKGLRCFGHEELEVLDSSQSAQDIHMLLWNIVDYIVNSHAVLSPGQTLGYTADQKLPISKSAGVNVEGETLKIEF